MPKIQPSRPDSGLDPPARFASDAEIALAEALRRQLEERYFGHPATAEVAAERTERKH